MESGFVHGKIPRSLLPNQNELVMGYRRIKKILPYKKVFIMTLILSLVIMVFMWSSDILHTSEQQLSEVIERIEVKNIKIKICAVNFNDNRDFIKVNPNLTMIYYVTPTYLRPEQTPELTRLSHTLMHVPRIHWIVADDTSQCSPHILNIIRRTGLPFTHIASPKPNFVENHTRGVTNRRAALKWIRNNIESGVIFFGDDDNTADLDLFKEIRKTKKVSMFPVGLIGEFGVSSPVIKNGKVVGFFDSWYGYRTFPVDMAGFAFNVDYLKPTADMPYILGQEENKFLVSLGLKMKDIQPLANNCSRILVWHTQTKKNKKSSIDITLEMLSKLNNTDNLLNLVKETTRMGMATIDNKSGIKPTIIRNHKSYPVQSFPNFN